ncbi:MAG: Esterase [Actinomycetia bacterium]|nr:Esterase [Actinomycetes bacterium]
MLQAKQRFVRISVIATALIALMAAPLGAARPALMRAASRPTTHTPVMGANLLNADQLARWYNHVRGGTPPSAPGVNNDVRVLAQTFIDEGRMQGVRGDLAFVQSIIETGWFSFPDYGQIRPWFNNFAGMFAFNGRARGYHCSDEAAPSRCFASAAVGIRTQIQLLRGYADSTTRNMRLLIHPPGDRIGVAPIWELFGGSSGKAIWATAPNYGVEIIKLYSEALVYSGARAACLPYSPGGSSAQSGRGYWVAGSDGGIQTFGSAQFFGSAGNLPLRKPIIGAESNPAGSGYWMAATDGGIFNYGRAGFYGSTGRIHLVAPILGMKRTVQGHGYWLVAFDGGVFSFGDARFHGSMGHRHLNAPVLGMERTASGNGYWLFASDGGLFSFGDARFYGSLGARHLPAPIVSMARTASGRGYWMLGADGSVYSFGDAPFYGSVAGCGFSSASRLLASPTGHGYWVETVDGTVIALGDARRLGFPARITGTAVGLMLRP